MSVSASVLAMAMLGAAPDAAAVPAMTAPVVVATPAAAPMPPVPADAASPSPSPKPDGAAPAPSPSTPAGGEIVVTARQGPPPGDPLEAVNATSFKAVQAVDQVAVGPAVHIYEKHVPTPLQDGVRNAMNNLSEPVNFINFMLQLKPGKALQALARFAINSTIGVAGLFDVAKNKPFHLKYRRNGFANTFGYYGIGQGPFLFLPLIGPTTPRDLIGRILDLSILPLAGKPFSDPTFTLVTGTLRSIDDRIDIDARLKLMRDDCPDFYAAEREWYLQTRKAEIEELHGRKYDLNAHLPDCLVPSPPPPLVPYAPGAAAPAPASPAPTGPAAEPSVPVPAPAPTPAPTPAPQPAVQPATM